jgi:hypothetical protein
VGLLETVPGLQEDKKSPWKRLNFESPPKRKGCYTVDGDHPFIFLRFR